MDDVLFSKKANISVINRFDKQVKDIVISASQVALYLFDAKKAKWVKRKVEGACFIYERKSRPLYGIFILNRLDTTNFIELINSCMDIQLQKPYILYRNIFKIIYGIWFYEKSECMEMAAVLQRILKELKDEQKEEEEDDDLDAPMKDKACTAELSDQNGVENSSKPNGQPDSVRQFFAKASKEVTKPLTIPQPSCSKTLCSSFQSVAHIEKAQKSDHLEHSPYSLTAFDVFADKNYKNELICPVSRLPTNDECEINLNVIESNMRSMNFDKSIEKLPQRCTLKEDLELPELIPPGLLLSSLDDLSTSYKGDVSDSIRNQKTNILTKTQMIQAMEYLLKNDAEFIDKLYDAYLKSARTN